MHSSRIATEADLPKLRRLVALAIDTLQAGFLDAAGIAASRSVMGLDTQLVTDRTDSIVDENGALVGCGGWSRRATLYGDDHTEGVRNDRLLDPAIDAARTRAMYTHFVRRGVGRRILKLCEAAAAREGFPTWS